MPEFWYESNDEFRIFEAFIPEFESFDGRDIQAVTLFQKWRRGHEEGEGQIHGDYIIGTDFKFQSAGKKFSQEVRGKDSVRSEGVTLGILNFLKLLEI